MPKRLIRFNLIAESSSKFLFLQPKQADFTIEVGVRTLALHTRFLIQSQYLSNIIKGGKKKIKVEHVHAESFEKLIGCFYGIEAAFERHEIIPHILDILALLKVQQLDQQLKDDMHNNFDEYGFFNLFQLSKILKVADTERQCLQALKEQEFEQINYNKYDLFQLDAHLFIFILQYHHKLKSRNLLQGIENDQILAIFQEYCTANSVKLDPQLLFVSDSVQDFSQKAKVQVFQIQACKPKRNASLAHEMKKKQKRVKSQENIQLPSQKEYFAIQVKIKELKAFKQSTKGVSRKAQLLPKQTSNMKTTNVEKIKNILFKEQFQTSHGQSHDLLKEKEGKNEKRKTEQKVQKPNYSLSKSNEIQKNKAKFLNFQKNSQSSESFEDNQSQTRNKL